MPEEVRDIIASLEQSSTIECGSRTYYQGKLEGQSVVVVLSRIGKVAAASTATTLIDRFKATTLFFTGVAGGIAPHLKQGDVVLAARTMQCDVDASAVMGFKRFEIPLLNRIYFELCEQLRAKARTAISSFIQSDPLHQGAALHEGLIASCDQFVMDATHKESLATAIPDLLAVEMEGGAVSQVCYEWGVPLLLIRSISDTTDSNSVGDFGEFVATLAAPLSAGVVRSILRAW